MANNYGIITQLVLTDIVPNQFPKVRLKSYLPSSLSNGLLALAKLVSKTVSNSDMKQYLPWPPWAT
jgi:hypothetical protein